MQNQTDYEHNKKDKEQNLCNSCGSERYTTKSQKSCD